jgi:SAM-dependent methyltransferase
MRHPLDLAPLYLLWQLPFIAQKVRGFRQRAVLGPDTRVLDVGCGPGTNASLFAGTRYMGVDRNIGYIRSARQRGLQVLVGDAAALPIRVARPFDCVFVNSLLHHLDDTQVLALLTHAAALVRSQGQVHVIDLVVPERWGVARSLALADRGDYPRALPHLRSLVARHFDLDVEEEFRLTLVGLPLWAMVYYRGTARMAR